MIRLLDDPAFRRELDTIARQTGQQSAAVIGQARRDLSELSGRRNGLAVSAFAALSHFICRRGYSPEIFFDKDELEKVREQARTKSVVFLVSHKTYLDFFVLYDFLYRHGIATPYMFGGINMAFPVFGPVARRAGGIFIRRTFADAPVYKAVLHRYIRHLIGEGCSFSWAIEGTRSRTGKLVLPKIGLLKYMADAARPLGDDAVAYIPVSVSYDQIPDVVDMTAQEAGASKQPESLGWFIRYVRRLGSHYGNIYIRFADAVTIADTPDAPDLHATGRIVGTEVMGVQKLAFEVCYLINEITPATVTSLVLMSLLCRTAASHEMIRADVRALQAYLENRQSSALFSSPSQPVDDNIDTGLSGLLDKGIVRREADSGRYGIVPARYLVALYYSNMAVHHFVVAALTELGLLDLADTDIDQDDAAFRATVNRLRDLFKFEFFFSRRDVFDRQVDEELKYIGAIAAAGNAQDGCDGESLLRCQPLLVAHGALSPFIDAYAVVAARLLELAGEPVADQAEFISGCQSCSRGLDADRPGVASRALLTNGYLLAENRGLLDGGEAVADRRRRFADELAGVAARLDRIRELATRASSAGTRV